MTDQLGYRATIGITVPSTNTVVQPEMEAMRPYGVTNHVARMAIASRPLNDDADFARLVDDLVKAQDAALEELASMAPDHLILGLSVETVWNEPAAAAAAIATIERRMGIGVSAASAVMVDALKEFGLGRVAVLTPYQPVGDARVRNFLEAAGIEVLAVHGLRSARPEAIARTGRRRLISALQELADYCPDAIVQMGTNLPLTELATEARDWLGLPVLPVNTLLYRDALKSTGCLDDGAFCARWLPFAKKEYPAGGTV